MSTFLRSRLLTRSLLTTQTVLNSQRFTALNAIRFQSTQATQATSSTPPPPAQPIKKQMVVERELPDPLKEVRANRYKFIAFVTLMAVSSVVIFNYEKINSPIVTTTLHFLRRSQIIREVIGDQIDFASWIPWVRGQLNQVQGKVNIEFYVKGSKKEGKVKLRADREDRLSDFLIHEWSLEVDGVVYDLLEDKTVDFAV